MRILSPKEESLTESVWYRLLIVLFKVLFLSDFEFVDLAV